MQYDDIIHLPHHVSPNRSPMPMYKRAAQFAPFSALEGLKENLEQTLQEHVAGYDCSR